MSRLFTMDRERLVAWYRRNRERSHAIFSLLGADAYYSQPIALRHPVVFYEGHLPAFSFNTLVKRALGRPGIDERLERLFARGIDPDAAGPVSATLLETWPERSVVQAFAAEADAAVLAVLEGEEIDRPGHPLLDRGEAVFAILEHEAMHHETLLYMWQRLPFQKKHRPPGYSPRVTGRAPKQEWIEVGAGSATLGVDRSAIPFGWDNEFGASREDTPAFRITRHNVTNAAFLEFVEAGGYTTPGLWHPDDWTWLRQEQIAHPRFWERHDGRWCWRGMFDLVPLPEAWPVYVSHVEAGAYARWSGARLPTEAEFQRAAYGTPDGAERPYPWGDQPPDATRGVFDFSTWDPEPVGSHPAGRSAWGLDDLVGNGWEWTSTAFGPFPGFRAMASYLEYSADFFDGAHFVMKGGSSATARELLRPTFRNWFRPHYPYVYGSFRLVKEAR